MKVEDVARRIVEDFAIDILGVIIDRPRLIITDGSGLAWGADVRASGHDDIWESVPIATANQDLMYADAGMPVTLRRNQGGRFEITGFAKRRPGRRVLVPVDLSTGVSGEPVDVGITSRLLTFEELYTVGPAYGETAYGALGIFRGLDLIGVR